MATIAGARAAHLDQKIGTLSPGKEADISRMIEKSRDGVLARAGYAADLFGTCCRT